MNRALRDQALQNLYANRQLLDFVNGPGWTEQQIQDIWKQYVTIARDATGVTIQRAIAQIEWEDQHGYLNQPQ